MLRQALRSPRFIPRRCIDPSASWCFLHHGGSLHGIRHLSNNPSKRHFERRLLPFTPMQCFDVVADVAKYKEFVPWVKGSVIVGNDIASSNSHMDSVKSLENRSSDLSVVPNEVKRLDAELEIGFGMFTEKYISHVTLIPFKEVRAVSNQTNLFENLKTEWKFTASKDKSSCWITFQVDFQFKSAVYDKLSELFLLDVANNMVKAFEKRCHEKYPTS